MHCLSDTDRNNLLDLTRQAVAEAVTQKRLLQDIPENDLFERPCGVFITLHVAGKLRGCIGVIQPKEPLGESISRCAFSAAVEDPRFPPIQPEELSKLEIEISLLSPLVTIQPNQIEIGRHGLLVEQGFRRGLLLPQVAVEHHLEREEFLAETCHKAGLPVDSWKKADTRIYGFTCEIVAEEKIKKPAP